MIFSISVIVPTYKRPWYLRNCLESIYNQKRAPDQVVVVVRGGDTPSLLAVKEFIAARTLQARIDIVMVHEAGFLPPVQAGIDAAQSDIVAFIDDDGEAHSDWLERLEQHYQNPQVGAAGGRVIKFFNRIEKMYKPAKIFGKVFWYGRCEGNLYRAGYDDEPRVVDCLMGSNMSYRASCFRRIHLDWTLKNGTAYQYELDLGLQMKAIGFKAIYDPRAKVNHFEAAERDGGAEQNIPEEQAYWMSFNTEYVIFKHCNFFRRCAAMIYQVFIGQSLCWGVLSLAWYWIRFRKMPSVFRASLAGRIAGIKTALFKKPIYLKSSQTALHEGANVCADAMPRDVKKKFDLPLAISPE